MSATVREATLADVPALLELWEGLNACGTAADPRFSIAADGRRWMESMMREDWFGRFLPFPACQVAEVDGRMVGFVSGRPLQSPPVLEREATARIDNLFVHPEHRRAGLARRLVERFCAAATDAGYATVEVNTLALDRRAVSFWRAVGFGDWMVLLRRDAG